MRYRIKISRGWQWFFSLFGFTPARSYVELNGRTLHFRYGTADEHVPLAEISGVAPRRWPFYYGLGAKFGPGGSVAYVGSTVGVVQIDFTRPRPMNVWGPFAASRARSVIVSIENADQFMEDLRAALNKTSVGSMADVALD